MFVDKQDRGLAEVLRYGYGQNELTWFNSPISFWHHYIFRKSLRVNMTFFNSQKQHNMGYINFILSTFVYEKKLLRNLKKSHLFFVSGKLNNVQSRKQHYETLQYLSISLIGAK